ncbi:AraC family transcriptional regulator [Undibacterium sp. TJN25]|uniref:AraC family transcriptional regulator n=1 Tax=Undibacterium sp. TJN25 TaxID=3413056 RepID=UPI003BF43F23
MTELLNEPLTATLSGPSKNIPLERRLDGDIPLLVLEQRAALGAGKLVHSHPEGQIYVAIQGLIVVDAAGTRWIMPPGRMGWIPPGIAHGASIYGAHSNPMMGGLTIYLEPGLCSALPASPLVLRVTDLMRELLKRLQQWPAMTTLDQAQRRMLAVFIDELRSAPAEPLSLTMPREPRLLKMAAAIADDPADETPLDEWADRIGLSRRSITRHFRRETGMSIIEWRQVARLSLGLQMLAEGLPVTTVSINLGYDSVSSFISLFRKMLGTTPARFAEESRSQK